LHLSALVLGLLVTNSVPASVPKPPSISGTWALKTVSAREIDVPVVGVVVSRSIALAALRIRQRGTRLSVKQKLCRLSLDTDSASLSMTLPKAFTRAFRWDKYSAELTRTDGRWRFERPEVIRVFGAKLQAPSVDRLPNTATDSRLRDHDRDGKPAVTMHIGGIVNGRIYFVSRDRVSFNGFLSEDANSAFGPMQLRRERVTVQASNPLLGKSPSSREHPDPAQSYFQMVRLSDGQACRDVLNKQRQLFKLP